jgi:cysteine synthase
VPKLANDALSAGLIDEFRAVPGADALAASRNLAGSEGILCGITSGATFAAALAVAREAPRGARILAMLPDTGERYLSTPLFADIPEAMTREEKEIAASTPRYRFDVKAPAAPLAAPGEPSPAAVMHVEQIVSDAEHQVVMFALEWCEFCWSVRRLFAAAGIAYRSVDLDSAEYRQGNWGGEVRNALARRTGAVTIPQIFVGGEHIGGATETFDAFNSGALRRRLEAMELSIEPGAIPDAYSFLPSWLHPR